MSRPSLVRSLPAAAAALALVFAGCSQGEAQGASGSGGGSLSSAAHGVAGVGKSLAPGSAADLRVTPDGRYALFLTAAKKPTLQGVPPQMLVGELYAVPLAGGAPRKLGSGVTNMPGGYLFSPDSRWVLFLTGYNASSQEGALEAIDLTDPKSEPIPLGKSVTYMLPSPDSKWLAFVDGGVLRVGELAKGPFVDVGGEVSTAQFSPDNAMLIFKRRLSAASGLAAVPVGQWKAVKKLADEVGDYAFSADSKRVAFTVRSEAVRGTYDLFLATAPKMEPKRVAVGTGVFAFSPDSKWLARTEGQKPELLGSLFVGPSDGSPGRKLGEKVLEVAFAPDSTAVAYLEKYDITARAGSLGVARLPDGEPKKVGTRVPNFLWGADGRFVAFLSRFTKPIYSVDLMLYPVGEEQAFKVNPGVFGYGFTPGNERLLYRTNCIREGRACDLFGLDLSKPKEPAKKLVEGIYSFKSSEGAERLLVSYARIDSQLFDVAAYNLKTGERKTLEQSISLPALFAAKDGSKVAYVVSDRDRPGVYVAEQVP